MFGISLGIIIVPALDILETACLARSKGSYDHPCVKVFSSAWTYDIDLLQKPIYISRNMDDYLINNQYKSRSEKRQALFSVIVVCQGFPDCSINQAQVELASILSISEDKDVYFVTDNMGLSQLLGNHTPFKVIDSITAVKMLNETKSKLLGMPGNEES